MDDPGEEPDVSMEQVFLATVALANGDTDDPVVAEVGLDLALAFYRGLRSFLNSEASPMAAETFFGAEIDAERRVILDNVLCDGRLDEELRGIDSQRRRMETTRQNAEFRRQSAMPRLFRMREDHFRSVLGLTEEAFDVLAELTAEYLEPGRRANRYALSARERLLVGLAFMRNGGRPDLTGCALGVVGRTVRRCAMQLESAMHLRPVVPLCFSFEEGEPWTTGAERGFSHFSGIRCVVLCIDGHKVGCKGVTGPRRFEWFCGSKGPALTMGYAVDDAQFARAVFGGAPASVGDMRCLRLSTLWALMETDAYDPEDPFIPEHRTVLGDSGYGLRDWLMVPWRESMLTKHPWLTPWMLRVYNFVHSAIRQKVEHFNGRLFQLFGFARSAGRDRSAAAARSVTRTAVGLSNFATVMAMQRDSVMSRNVLRRRRMGALRPAGPELERWDRSDPPSEATKRAVAQRNQEKVALAFVANACHRLVVRGQRDIYWRDALASSSGDVPMAQVLDAERMHYVTENAAGRLSAERRGWAVEERPEWLRASLLATEAGAGPTSALFAQDRPAGSPPSAPGSPPAAAAASASSCAPGGGGGSAAAEGPPGEFALGGLAAAGGTDNGEARSDSDPDGDYMAPGDASSTVRRASERLAGLPPTNA